MKMTSLIAPVLVLAVNLATFVLSQNEQICLSLQRGPSGPPQGKGQQCTYSRPAVPRVVRGRKGMKGDVGPPGQCQCNVSEVIELRERLDELEHTSTETIVRLNRLYRLFREDLCLVGVKSGKVEDEDMTASSVFDDYYAAHEGRLDRTDGGGNYWQPPAHRWHSPGEWLQVDLKTPTTMTGVVTQGRPDSSKWVTSFKIAFGNFTDHLKMIQDFDEEDVIFRGNRDRSSHVVNMFPNPVTARYFRLIVQTFHDFIALRLDYLTC